MVVPVGLGGPVTIAEGASTPTPPAGFQVLGQEVDITVEQWRMLQAGQHGRRIGAVLQPDDILVGLGDFAGIAGEFLAGEQEE